jgi:hypothetical protein
VQVKIELPTEFVSVMREIVRTEILCAADQFTDIGDNQLMTVSDVAKFMQISISTVRQFMILGLPHFQEGQVIRFLKSDVINWTRNNSQHCQK